MTVFNKTIIPLALGGYDVIIANSYPTRTRGVIDKYKRFAEKNCDDKTKEIISMNTLKVLRFAAL